MKAFLLACLATAAIAVAADVSLAQLGFGAAEVFSKPSVRLD